MDAFTSTFLVVVLIPIAAASWLMLWFHKGALLPGLVLHILNHFKLISDPPEGAGPFLLAEKKDIDTWLMLKAPPWLSLLLGCPYCASVHLCFWFGLLLGVLLGSPLWYALPFIGALYGPFIAIHLFTSSKNGTSK